MPEIHRDFDFLRGLFFSLGQGTPTGMGMVPVDWEKLRAWRLENHIHLTIWEKETLIKMSEAYCAEYSQAIDPQRPAPYKVVTEDLSEDEQYQRAIANAIRMRDALRRGGKKR